MKQKVIAILLFGLWMFQSCFVFLFYELERTECRIQHFARRPADKPVQTFFFHKFEKPTWTVEGKEFLLHGKLYDVVAMAEIPGRIVVRCFADSKEDRIVARFQDYIHAKSKQNPSKSKIKKVFASKYVRTETQFLLRPVFFENTPPGNIPLVRYCFSIEIIPPPPKFG